MEVINGTPGPKEPLKKEKTDERITGGYVYLGVMLIVFGGLLLMYNFDMLDNSFFRVFLSWQMVMIVIGGYLLSIRKFTAGFIVLGIGVLFLMLKLIGSTYIMKVGLPLSIIVAGIILLISLIRKK